MTFRRGLWLAAGLVATSSLTVFAQTEPNPVAAARIHLGPIGVTPDLTVSTGVDDNVFNETVDPKQDVTAGMASRVRLWFQMRRLLVAGDHFVNAVGYKEYSSQGGLGTRHNVRLSIPVNRVQLSLIYLMASEDQRPSLEIDARVRSHDTNLTAAADVRTAPRTILRLSASRGATSYAEDATYEGVVLAETLNRRFRSGELSLRYALTGATTLMLGVEHMRERFEFSPERDSQSTRIAPGVEFFKGAIITGRASAGVRRFSLESPGVPDFTGPVAAIALESTVRGDTRFGVQANRDVAYSFKPETPYYVQAGASLFVSRRLAERWDITAQIGRQRLSYRADSSTGGSSSGERTDRVLGYGGAVTYRLGRSMRLQLGVERSERRSDVDQRGYETTRASGQFLYVP